MANAYQCDRCGNFFPGLARDRYLPYPHQRYESATEKGLDVELCRKCEKEFDGRMLEFYTTFSESKNRYKGKIKSDTGHETIVEEIQP